MSTHNPPTVVTSAPKRQGGSPLPPLVIGTALLALWLVATLLQIQTSEAFLLGGPTVSLVPNWGILTQVPDLVQGKLTREQAADLGRARKEQQRVLADLERQKRTLLKQQTRTARRTRLHAVPFAIVGVGFSATAGGLFWHQVLSALDLPLNLSISTMFALAVSVTFIQNELFKHAQGESIKEAMRTNEMQTELFKQQAEDIVMETTIEALEGVRNDPAAMSDVQHTVKKEIKATIKHLTARAASRLVRVEEVQQRTPHRLSAPRTDHVQTTDSRGDRSVWIGQDTTADRTGQRTLDTSPHETECVWTRQWTAVTGEDHRGRTADLSTNRTGHDGTGP